MDVAFYYARLQAARWRVRTLLNAQLSYNPDNAISSVIYLGLLGAKKIEEKFSVPSKQHYYLSRRDMKANAGMRDYIFIYPSAISLSNRCLLRTAGPSTCRHTVFYPTIDRNVHYTSHHSQFNAVNVPPDTAHDCSRDTSRTLDWPGWLSVSSTVHRKVKRSI